MTKNTLLLAALAATSALATGCNFGRQPTAGEQMLDATRPNADSVAPNAPAPVVVAQNDAPSGITVPSTTGGPAQPTTAQPAEAQPSQPTTPPPTPAQPGNPTTASLAATNPATAPAGLAVPPADAVNARVNPPPSTIASTPSTTPAARSSPAERGPRLYVAADADEATRIRNWRPVTNYYPTGNVIAGPTYRIEVPPPRTNRASDIYLMDLAQTFMVVPQSLATPFWMFITPPNTPVEYHGEVYPPSYTVDDPYPYYQNEKVPGVLELTRKPKQ
jgi:hypothetical protein